MRRPEEVFVFVRRGNRYLVLHRAPRGGSYTLTFTVEDIDAARAYLEGEGVRFDGDTSQVEDMVRLATFYDPDGNALMLAEQLR